jgi:hypothetical protein
MSETTETPEAANRATDSMARAGHDGIDAVGKVTKAATSEAGHAAQAAADRAKEAGDSIADTVVETASVAADLSTKAAKQSREALLLGMRTAAGVSGRVADISFGRGHDIMSSAAHTMDIYRDASERSAERVQALFSSAMILGRGWQQMQHAWLEMIDHTMEHAAHKPQDVLRCRNAVELAEVQRDLYLDAINHAFESAGRLLGMAERTAQDAMRPLQSHH